MSYQYNRYLEQHRFDVIKGFNWLKENLPDIVSDINTPDYLNYHDKSKFNRDEYDAYDMYFYGGNRSYSVVQNFNLAWLKHIHRNPHHWQHWVLVNDDPDKGSIALDMPYNYIVEMICDWWSFSWKTGNLNEIFDWYDEHKSYMILSDNTRNTVERILGQIKDKLQEKEEENG